MPRVASGARPPSGLLPPLDSTQVAEESYSQFDHSFARVIHNSTIRTHELSTIRPFVHYNANGRVVDNI